MFGITPSVLTVMVLLEIFYNYVSFAIFAKKNSVDENFCGFAVFAANFCRFRDHTVLKNS